MSLSVKLVTYKEDLIEAHQRACLRDNSSTMILQSAFESNGGDLIKAIAAAMMTIGGSHAPIKYAYMMYKKLSFLYHNEDNIKPLLDQYELIPGFGSSFAKEEPDPMLSKLALTIVKHFPEWGIIIRLIQNYLIEERDKLLHPNLATYTAVYAIIASEGVTFCESILIESRIPIWIDILKNGR